MKWLSNQTCGSVVMQGSGGIDLQVVERHIRGNHVMAYRLLL